MSMMATRNRTPVGVMTRLDERVAVKVEIESSDAVRELVGQ
jgi:hypothetical protein